MIAIFGRGVAAADVVARIGLREAQPLGLRERLLIAEPVRAPSP